MTPNEWLVWQLADSGFPTGGFAHSGGLEAAFQHGELGSSAELRAFLEASLEQFGHASLPFMTSAHRDPRNLRQLDQLCDCFTTNHVANRASRLQGQAMLASTKRIFVSSDLQRLQGTGAEPLEFCHLAPVFGGILSALEVELLAAARLFVFTHLRGLVASAVRLGIVGPLEGQALQHSLSGRAERTLLRCQNLSVEEISQTSPLLDLWQANQSRLYSRLFQS